MLFVHLLVNETLLDAEANLSRNEDASRVVEFCSEYLTQLRDYFSELQKLGTDPTLANTYTTPLARELTDQVRRAIRTAIEVTSRERNFAERLLESLTVMSGYEAMQTFNQLSYLGHRNWQVRSDGIHAGADFLTVTESVETALNLRRSEYATSKRTFFERSGVMV